MKARDVVVQVDGEPVGAPSACFNDDDAAGTGAMDDGVEVELPPLHRKMGDVYKIMKNTIFEDEDFYGEELHLYDYGARFISYVNGVASFLFEHPKTFGLLLTTTIVLLFFKYSQNIVTSSVHYALASHPGLEPTDEIQSSLLFVTHEMRSFMTVARALGELYVRGNATASSAESLMDAAIIDDFYSNLIALEQKILRVYVTTLIRDADGVGHWGEAGCQRPLRAAGSSSTALESIVCSYVDTEGVGRGFVGRNLSGTPEKVVHGQFLDGLEFTDEISRMTRLSAPHGYWHKPFKYLDPYYNKQFNILTFSLPVLFDSPDPELGKCIAAVCLDVSLIALGAAINMDETRNSEVLMVDSRFFRESGGLFVTSSVEPRLFTGTQYPADRTPSTRVNNIVTSVLKHNRGTLMMNQSYFEDGLIYQTLTMLDTWALIAVQPQVLSAAQVEGSFRGLMNEYEQIAQMAIAKYNGGYGCIDAADQQLDSPFVDTVGVTQRMFGTRVNAVYAVYQLDDAMKEGGEVPAERWGACGCNFVGKHLNQQQCFYTDANAVVSAFNATRISTVLLPQADCTTCEVKRQPFTETRRHDFVREYVLDQINNGPAHRWTAPYFIMDPSSDVSLNAVSFIKPFVDVSDSGEVDNTDGSAAFTFTSPTPTSSSAVPPETSPTATVDHAHTPAVEGMASPSAADAVSPHAPFSTAANSNVVAQSVDLSTAATTSSPGATPKKPRKAAVVIDISLTFLPDFLRAYIHPGTIALILIDRRGNSTFMGTRTSMYRGDVYTSTSTPNETVNTIMSTTFSILGDTFDMAGSYAWQGNLVNYQLVHPYWAIAEVIPGNTALNRYIPKPSVKTATDALRLIPTGETIVLFLYVAGILAAYFINLLILGCSKLGEHQGSVQKTHMQPPQLLPSQTPSEPPPSPSSLPPVENETTPTEARFLET